MSGLTVLSETMPDGTYGVSITVGEDRAFTLARDAAVAYAVSAFATATEAEHDLAVLRLLTTGAPTGIGMPRALAAEFMVKDIRPDRPDHRATEPLRFVVAIGQARVPHVDAGEFQSAVRIRLAGLEVGYVSPDELREHASGVLNALAAVDLDASLHRCLVAQVGLSDDHARGIVGSLSEFMPEAAGR